MATALTFPGGSDKGKLVTDPTVTIRSLEYWRDNAKREELRTACRDEIQRRSSGGAAAVVSAPATNGTAAAEAQQQTALAVKDLSGAFRDHNRVTAVLQKASEQAHLIAPAPVCGTLPEGCEVAIAAVLVDPDTETYGIKGEKGSADEDLGLSKVALDKISAALGIDWDPVLSCRLDDGSDPYYWHHRAVGRVKNFDGSTRTVCGEKEVDMRPGSPQCESIRLREEKKKRDYESKTPAWVYKGDLGASQIREMRLFISGHAETKARLRAIRSLGIRTSYKRHELAKPFVCARTIFTGQSDNPEAAAQFRAGTMQAFLGAGQALYGSSPQQAPAPLPASQQVIHAPVTRHQPPPVGAVIDADDYVPTFARQADPARQATPTTEEEQGPPDGWEDAKPTDKPASAAASGQPDLPMGDRY